MPARPKMAALGQREAQLKQIIQQRMREASKALIPAGEVSLNRSKDGTALDVERLTRDRPDLIET